jgi:hypothetical protein
MYTYNFFLSIELYFLIVKPLGKENPAAAGSSFFKYFILSNAIRMPD